MITVRRHLLTAALLAPLCLTVSHRAFAQEHWTDDARETMTGQRFAVHAVDSGMRLPTPRYGMPAVVVGDSIFVVGGSGPDGFLGDVVKITPRNHSVTTVAKTLLPRRYHAAASAGDFIYVFGGVSPTDSPANITDVVERFDTRTGEVKKLAPMPTPCRLPGAVTIGTKIYVIGGSDRTGRYAGTVAIYDIPTDTWSAGAPMPDARECSFVVRYASIYAVGGFNGAEAMKNVDVYRFGENKWTALPPLPFTLSAHHIALMNGRIYAFGDYNVPERGAVYDFQERRWGPLVDSGFVGSRNNPVVALNGTLYVLGGNTNASGNTLDLIQSFVPRL